MAKYMKKTTVGSELALKTQDPRKYCEGVGNAVNKSRIPRMPITRSGCPCTVLLDAAIFRTTPSFNYRQYAAEVIVTLTL